MTKELSIEERYELVTRNLQEVIGEEELKEKLKSNNEFAVYWGTMPTGPIQLGYFFPMLKIADFLRAGLKVKLLIADIHAALDSTPWNLVDHRFDFYKHELTLLLKAIGVDVSKLEFVKGSEFQLKPEFMYDVLQLSSLTSVHDAKKAASEVVKQIENPKVAGIIYPLMQVLDEQYLEVDAQFGGMDQRKIMVLAREFLPKLGYEARVELLNPIIRGLVGEKMSSSDPNSKIDLMEDEETVKKKVNKAYFLEGDINNGIMDLLKYFIFVIKNDQNKKLIIQRPDKFGGNKEYSNPEELEKDVISKEMHPMDVKVAVANEINLLLKLFREDKKIKELYEKAYPKN
jgi:tyrosyl-tRNA synthetase